MTPPLLVATDIWKTFRVPRKSVLDEARSIHALRGVSLTIDRGETVPSWGNRARARPR